MKEEGKELRETKNKLIRTIAEMESTIKNMLAYQNEVEELIDKTQDEIVFKKEQLEEKNRLNKRS